MSTNQKQALALIAVVIIYLVYFSASSVNKRKREKQSQIINYKSNKKNHLHFLYKLYTKMPVVNRYFRKIISRLETMYPADRFDISIKATKDMTYALLTSGACAILFILISKGDIFYLGMGVVLTYVLFTQTINIQMEHLESKLDAQFSDFLSDVRHYYHDAVDVCDAVYSTLDDLPYELGLHINKIYTILTSTHAEEEVEKYTDIAPNRFLMMFAAICVTIKEYGDKRLENGQWMFINNLEHLKDELNVEILKKKRNNYLFSGFKFIVIAPIFFLKPIEKWATTDIPEMSDFYTGGTGTIVMAVIFVVTMLAYQLIGNLKDGRVDEMKESVLLTKLAELPVIRKFLTAEVNRNYTKSLRYGDDLKIVGDNIGPREFLLKRILYGIAFAIAFNFVVIFAQGQAKDNLLHDFASSYENSLVPNSEYRETMRTVSEDYMTMYSKDSKYEEHREEAVNSIVAREGIKESYANEIVDEVFNRIASIRNMYYKWYYMIFAVIAFLCGFYLPYFILKYQISIMKMNMEDEVVQFQTLAMILMHVDGMTLDTILLWMERFAFCFKASVSECIVNLEYSSQKALQKMKDSEPFPPFKRFTDNLMSIDNVGIVSAFDEIESERDFYKKKREQDNEMMMSKKSSLAKTIAFIPFGIVVGGYMILPFLQMVLSMVNTMNSAMTTM